jgi:hypothetical protein
MTCPQCYACAHEIARLQAQLRCHAANAIPTTPITPLATVAGLTPQQEVILRMLWNAQGDAVTTSALTIALGKRSGKVSVRVQLYRIKEKLGVNILSNRYGAGYHLTAEGLKIVNQLMETGR